jgi:hypothetical protein
MFLRGLRTGADDAPVFFSRLRSDSPDDEAESQSNPVRTNVSDAPFCDSLNGMSCRLFVALPLRLSSPFAAFALNALIAGPWPAGSIRGNQVSI